VVGWGLGAPSVTGPLARLRQWDRRMFLCSLDALVAYSQRGAQEYRGLGFAADRVFVAPNAAAPRPTASPERATRPEGAPPLVLFVGRLQVRKRLDLLFHACAALPPALQPRLWVVGDGPARAEFESQAQAVYPRVEFLGARHGAELQPIFAAADLFVLPGTGGLAVQEAMAAGLPVIVAEGDGTQEDLVRPGNGWLVQPDDLGALRRVLAEALSDLPRLQGMGRESFRIVAEEVNLEAMAEVFVQALCRASEQARCSQR
jgi:glycosyltransferase involved in cell wall biosynthesis